MNYPVFQPPQFNPAASGITTFNPKAVPLFERALLFGQVRHLFARLLRRPHHLLTLSQAATDTEIHKPQQPIPCVVAVDQIKGSVNHSEDYDRAFYPLNDRLRTRWVRIASMMLQKTPLPPVELIQVGETYFVLDGHHRVSVAKMLGDEMIDAVVVGMIS